MRGYTHLAFALAAASSIQVLAHRSALSLEVAVAGISALLPDIDHPDSLLGRKIKPISWLINKLLGHRTITHSLDFAIGLCVVVLLSSNFSYWAWMFVLGYMSHLILDSLTLSGIKLSMLRQNSTIGFKLVKTGGVEDTAIFIVCLLILSFLITKHA
ncbi:inner membrane protein [Caldicellulosiruptor bescii]|uniref:Membrane-bound metal-dependent hydrolase n=2 Tax=Caldicellulosiruptor bescii TaxID=31899 RepID=B9MNI3_CALBD|nr:metal-dependent hydrolase [Caldicellulosiruptor bescii]ACM61514.1 membrane-bound metal-dependent hydrolase [Caldicellulosiruptor bescii DSM 6725]PBC88674.1 inner membrane protein [Caldicellulosiruptor bescii]PBC91845.1 inner membrane protein [Caldicellulosiruptor bescii]PBD02744.1 inner membrane protein [Caldicellulosiruptor bescii]PBD07639.1 inner membrane protein [Caldicellulosiruptor bescii]